MGFVVLVMDLNMELGNVNSIIEWPTPRCVIEVRSFNGLESFCRKFIKIFSRICLPLTKKMRGIKDFTWTIGEARIFYLLNKKIT